MPHDPADVLRDLGFQATQLITSSAQPLQVFQRLTQDFPKYATSLARHVGVNASVRAAVLDNQMHAQPGINIGWLNGAVVKDKDMDPFACVVKPSGGSRLSDELCADF